MDKNIRKVSRTLWVGIGLLIVILAVAFVLSRLQPPTTPLMIIGPVADFTLTNQNNEVVTLADLRGHVWVADIIFTRCAGPCPKMTRQMKALQDALPKNSQAKLVTLTTDAKFDTPEVLKKYGEKAGADFNRWMFLTGGPEEIATLAVNSLKLSAMETKPEERQSPADLFVHSTYFVVVDKQGRLRSVFETAGEGVDQTKQRREILSTVKKLEGEN